MKTEAGTRTGGRCLTGEMGVAATAETTTMTIQTRGPGLQGAGCGGTTGATRKAAGTCRAPPPRCFFYVFFVCLNVMISGKVFARKVGGTAP